MIYTLLEADIAHSIMPGGWGLDEIGIEKQSGSGRVFGGREPFSGESVVVEGRGDVAGVAFGESGAVQGVFEPVAGCDV